MTLLHNIGRYAPGPAGALSFFDSNGFYFTVVNPNPGAFSRLDEALTTSCRRVGSFFPKKTSPVSWIKPLYEYKRNLCAQIFSWFSLAHLQSPSVHIKVHLERTSSALHGTSPTQAESAHSNAPFPASGAPSIKRLLTHDIDKETWCLASDGPCSYWPICPALFPALPLDEPFFLFAVSPVGLFLISSCKILKYLTTTEKKCF